MPVPSQNIQQLPILIIGDVESDSEEDVSSLIIAAKQTSSSICSSSSMMQDCGSCSSCRHHDKICCDQRTCIAAAATIRYSNQHRGRNLGKIFFFLLMMAILWDGHRGITAVAAKITTVPKSNLLKPNNNNNDDYNNNIISSDVKVVVYHQSLDDSTSSGRSAAAVGHHSRKYNNNNNDTTIIPISSKPNLLFSDPRLSSSSNNQTNSPQHNNELLQILPTSNGSYPSAGSVVAVPRRLPRAASSRHKKECQALDSNLLPEEKLVLSPIVIQGRLISRSNAYNNLYFVSFRVLKVMKGKVPKKLRKHIRLMFHMDNAGRDGRSCRFPVRFSVRSGRKYVLFITKLGPARYAANARPELWAKPIKKQVKKILCTGCALPPRVSSLHSSLSVVDEGSSIKIKCKVQGGNPAPKIKWVKAGHAVIPNFRSRIKSKKRRSTLRIANVQRTDSGTYTCQAENILGKHSQSISITVRYSAAPDPLVSNCPIQSFCLNGGKCLYYEFIGELVCRCKDGYAGQRCQFKKALIDLPFVEHEACGPYGHDIHFREICAAWKRPPVTEMSREEFKAWERVERQLGQLKDAKEKEEIHRFRQAGQRVKLEALALTDFKRQEEEEEEEEEKGRIHEE